MLKVCSFAAFVYLNTHYQILLLHEILQPVFFMLCEVAALRCRSTVGSTICVWLILDGINTASLTRQSNDH